MSPRASDRLIAINPLDTKDLSLPQRENSFDKSSSEKFSFFIKCTTQIQALQIRGRASRALSQFREAMRSIVTSQLLADQDIEKGPGILLYIEFFGVFPVRRD